MTKKTVEKLQKAGYAFFRKRNTEGRHGIDLQSKLRLNYRLNKLISYNYFENTLTGTCTETAS
jgi:hypothetical protein